MPRKLIPKPHMIKSVRARNWSLSGAIEELLDNSALHGLANDILIVIDNDRGIAVWDNGIGIDDINRIFCLGDASAYDDWHQIGQYGVGATNATIYLGDAVSVETVRDGRKHLMSVDWAKVEKSGEWPDAYEGKGRRADKEERGTIVCVTRLTRYYKLESSERMAKEFGQIFAPALRVGTKIKIIHRFSRGPEHEFIVEPYTPHDLDRVINIKGEVKTDSGQVMRWTGRAGLSPSLSERFNAVHIAFRHRVIEPTRDPFMGKSVPTFYAEVQLDETTPWKYQLAEHKDKVVYYRDELMSSIYEAIKDLLADAEHHAKSLALNIMVAPIESAINKVMKGMGMLHYDPDEKPEEGGGERKNGKKVKHKAKRLRNSKDEGEQGKAVPRNTGINIEWVEPAVLEGRAFSWMTDGALMTIKLDKSLFENVIQWPPKARDHHTVHLIVSFLSHAIEMLYWDGSKDQLCKVLTRGLVQRIEQWAEERGAHKIAPYLYREIISGVAIS